MAEEISVESSVAVCLAHHVRQKGRTDSGVSRAQGWPRVVALQPRDPVLILGTSSGETSESAQTAEEDNVIRRNHNRNMALKSRKESRTRKDGRIRTGRFEGSLHLLGEPVVWNACNSALCMMFEWLSGGMAESR